MFITDPEDVAVLCLSVSHGADRWWIKGAVNGVLYLSCTFPLHMYQPQRYKRKQGILKGEVSLHHWPPFYWFGLVCFANKNNKNGKLSYSWFQTSQTGGQQYSDTSPLSIPWRIHRLLIMITSIITSITLMKNNATEHCKTFPGPFFHLPPPPQKFFSLN